MTQMITVIVPVYNVEKYLDRCIESVVNQTYKNLEIILVDDGSPDNCPAMCDAWAEKDNRIKVIHKENGGVSSARNIGLDNANGEYIGFVDSDDYIAEDMFENLFNKINTDNCQMSVCGIFFQGKSISFKNEELISGNEAINRLFNYRDYQSFSGWTWNKLFLASVIKQNRLKFDENICFCEDVLFVYEYLKSVEFVKLINKSFYYYTFREDACTVNKNYKNDSEILKLIDYFFNDITDEQIMQQVLVWSLKFWVVCVDNYAFEGFEKSAGIISRKRIKKHIKQIYKSKKLDLATKIKCTIVVLFPFKIYNCAVKLYKKVKDKI
ncbi:MAG: glycosyltransferase family 2 protein [Eubacterium sp.]